MSLDLLGWVLAIEIMVVGLFALYLFAFVLGRQKKEQRKAVSLITKSFRKSSSQRAADINMDAALLLIGEPLLGEFLQEIDQAESLLHQQITKVFLQKDEVAFNLCSKKIEAVSSSYRALLGQLASSSKIEASSGGEEQLKVDLGVAMSEQERLNGQLKDVLTTLDDVSSEYANLFSSNKDKEELNMSKDKMMELFTQGIDDEIAV